MGGHDLTLSDLANIVEIIGIFALLAAIVFGIIQIRQHREQMQSLAIQQLAASFESADFTEGYRLLASLEDDISADALNALGEEYVAAVLRVGMKFETVGLLVHKRIVPFEMMNLLVGGAAVKIWRVVRLWTEESRNLQNHLLLFEWFQWLAERLEERAEIDRQPAYKIHKSWQQ